MRESDTLVVHSMDRLARNLIDLMTIVKDLTSKNIKIRFIKESLTFTNENTPMSNLMLSVIGAFAEFERAIIKERQMEGIKIAKTKGLYKGRKPSLTASQVEDIKIRVSNGDSKTKIAHDFNICRETLYQYIKKEPC